MSGPRSPLRAGEPDAGVSGGRASRERALAAAIGPLGVWDAGLAHVPAASARRAAVEFEAAGYGAAWLHEANRDAFTGAAMLLAATDRLVLGTSIVSIWRHEPDRMASAARTLGEAFPGRFVLGLGPSHEGAGSWHGRRYTNPLADMTEYLDAMDGAQWLAPPPDPPVPRVLAALGPRMLDLARQRSRGAIPYFVPVEHTRFARDRLGPDPVLAVHLAAVVGRPRPRALEAAHAWLERYIPWPNYRVTLQRFGFTDRDLSGRGSARLVDALVAIGDADEVAARVRAHLDAGADHVCVDLLDREVGEVPVARLQEIATAHTDDRSDCD